MTFEFSGSGKLVFNCKAELLRGILKRTSLAELPDSKDDQLVAYKKMNWMPPPHPLKGSLSPLGKFSELIEMKTVRSTLKLLKTN